MTQVPYKGGAGPAIIDLLAGNVDVMFVTLSSAAQFVKAGKLKAFAVSTSERVASLPEVPTMVEVGFPEDVSRSWQGLFAVAGTPPPIVAKLHAAVVQAMADPDVRKRMIAASMLPTSSPTPEELQDVPRRRIGQVEAGGGTDQGRGENPRQPLTLAIK